MAKSKPQAMIGGIEERNGRLRENDAARVAKHLLEQHLVYISIRNEEQTTALYYDPKRQQYWELIYLETGKYREGPPSLIPVAHEDIEERYGVQPLPKLDKVSITSEALGGKTTWIDKVAEHLIEEHLIKIDPDQGWKRLYWDPVDNKYFDISRDMIASTGGDIGPAGVTVYKSGSYHMLELSHDEVAGIYGSVLQGLEDPDLDELKRQIT